MKYKYIASQVDGKVIEGEIDVNGPAEVLEMLSAKGLRPISIKAVSKMTLQSSALFGGQITVSDKVFLVKYLALMLKVGTDLLKAINILIDDFDKPAMKSILVEIRKSLEQGKPFYTTFANHPNIFSGVFVNLVKSGETSGNLETVFTNLSVSLEKEQELQNKIRSALIYPGILLLMSFFMILFLVTFALPRIAEMFQSGGFNPPLFSKVVFAVGAFVGAFAWIIIPLLILAIVGFWWFFTKSRAGRLMFFRGMSFVPVVNGIIKKLALQRFSRTFGSLLRAGLPILEALEITADTVGHEELKMGLLRISREGVAKGLTIGEAFKRETVFPKTVTNLISVSERAGHVEDVLDTLADFYETEIDVSVKTLVSFVEPMMLLFLGLIVGGIALAVIIPIYQLVGQF